MFIVTEVRLYRDGLAHLLGANRSLHLLGASAPDDNSIARIAALQPMVVLIDSAAVRRTSIVRRIAEAAPESNVVAFALSDDHNEILACAEAGVAGYIARDASLDELVAILSDIGRGELPCSHSIATLMFRHATSLAREQVLAPASSLTTRERQILSLVDRGCSNKEIASALSIELATVKNHVHHILEKMHVSRRGVAAAIVRTKDSDP